MGGIRTAGGSRRPASQAQLSLTAGRAADLGPATSLDLRWAALWDARTESSCGPSGLRKDKRLKAEAPSRVASAHLATAPDRGSRRKGLRFPEGSGILMTVLAELREATAESRGENCGLSLSASPPDRSF